ncbi:hypothetical protein M0R45_026501 [Rubus argutus]|uniref:Uncharacterized protein n=1 Tax=Rubus argutus TaxID=59490 RepID=A0AAW1X027_RUBAR
MIFTTITKQLLPVSSPSQLSKPQNPNLRTITTPCRHHLLCSVSLPPRPPLAPPIKYTGVSSFSVHRRPPARAYHFTAIKISPLCRRFSLCQAEPTPDAPPCSCRLSADVLLMLPASPSTPPLPRFRSHHPVAGIDRKKKERREMTGLAAAEKKERDKAKKRRDEREDQTEMKKEGKDGKKEKK